MNRNTSGSSSGGGYRQPSRGGGSSAGRPRFQSGPGGASRPRFPSAPGGASRGPRTGGFGSRGGFGAPSGSRSFGGGYAPRGNSFGGGGRGFGGGGYRGGSRGGARRVPGQQYIDPSKFINKAVITEEVEHFVPEHNFQDFVIHEQLKKSVINKGYKTPTPIQDRAIPHILKGADVFGIANTGTGKTAAFLIPLIDKVLKNRKEQVLILAPTRELAIQIGQELKEFTAGMKIFSAICVGGAPIGPQLRDLRFHNNFIIGTPGRVKDFIDNRKIILSQFNTIVLDEADRMLDMGFIGDMRFVMAGMPKDRHTLFFSATLSPDIEKLIKEFLREPVRISVKTRDTAKNIDQDVVRIPQGGSKLEALEALLSQEEFNKVIIFSRTKHGTEKLSRMLVEKGFKSQSIHGNKSHGQRQQALRLFKDNHVQVLVATDVAARGLDIADVSHVINFDIPATYEDYVHRIGRTGRGDKRGKALTFLE